MHPYALRTLFPSIPKGLQIWPLRTPTHSLSHLTFDLQHLFTAHYLRSLVSLLSTFINPCSNFTKPFDLCTVDLVFKYYLSSDYCCFYLALESLFLPFASFCRFVWLIARINTFTACKSEACLHNIQLVTYLEVLNSFGSFL